MKRKSETNPPIPDLAIVREVIRLADNYAAARNARNAAHPERRVISGSSQLEQEPERWELVEYLRPLSPECLAGLYALYRVGERRSGTPRSYANHYHSVYSLAIQPHHRESAAADLAAKAPLADWLRRGIQHLGLDAGPAGTRGPGDTTLAVPSRIRP